MGGAVKLLVTTVLGVRTADVCEEEEQNNECQLSSSEPTVLEGERGCMI